MAFTVTIPRDGENNKSGAVFTDAYAKITNPQHDIENDQLIVNIDVYGDATHRNIAGSKPLYSFYLEIPGTALGTIDHTDVDRKNILKTAVYTYLKASVSTFSGAVQA
jgi:hypothetical protein